MKQNMQAPLIKKLSAMLDLENKGLESTILTNDFLEAQRARRKKREPRFGGR